MRNLSTGVPMSESFQSILRGVVDDPASEHSLGAVAARAGVSVRHLNRLFVEHVGITPAPLRRTGSRGDRQGAAPAQQRPARHGGQPNRIRIRRDDASRVSTRRPRHAQRTSPPQRTRVGTAMNGSRPSTRRLKPVRVVGTAVFVLLAAATFTYVMPRVVDLSRVWDGVRALTWRELGVLGLASATHIAIAGTVLLAATPGLTYRQALVVNEASTATSNTVPGGTALALGLVYRMLGSWGFSKTRSTLAITVSGTWNILTKLAMTVVAAVLLAVRGASGGRLVAGAAAAGALVAAAVAIAVVLDNECFLTRAGEAASRLSLRLRRRLRHQPTDGWGQAAAKYRDRAIGVIRRCWIRLTLSALASYLSLYLILLVTLRAVGISNAELNWIDVLAVLAIVRLIAAIPLSPGGLGIVELGLIAGLTSSGGDRAQIVVAVLAYRLLTYVVPIVVGFFAYVYWRNNNSWLNSAPPFDPRLTEATSI
jgi:putative heme transporter